jgi:hypothetical protein
MIRLLQQFFTSSDYFFKETLYRTIDAFWHTNFQIKLYVTPTLFQRLGVDSSDEVQFAYQKAESRFDNYSIRAIIRDDRF